MIASLAALLGCADDGPVSVRDPDALARAAPPAISGGGLALAGGRLIASDADHDRVLVVHPDASAATGTLELLPGDEPGRIADAGGRAIVVLRGAGDLLAFDPASLAVAWRVEVCAAPHGIAWDPDAALVRVACASGELVSVDADGAVVHRVGVAPDLRDVVVEGGRTWVSTFRRADVLRLDASGAVEDAYHPPDTQFEGSAPSRASVAWAMAARPEGGVTLLHQWRSMETIVVGQGDSGLGGGEYGGTEGACDSVVLGGTTTIDALGRLTTGGALRSAPLAVDLAASADGWDLAVAAGGVPRGVQVLATDAPGASACLDLPSGPKAPEHTVAVLRDDDGRLWALGRQPVELRVDGFRVALPGPPADADPGFALFHRATASGLACASCHPEAVDDGQTWSFDVGPRRTQSLRTDLLATAPYHWDGEFGTMSALMDDVLVGRMGGEPASAPDVARLLGWLGGLPVPRAAERPDPDLVARGERVFDVAGCAACHAGETLTDDRAHDVGTGGAFQTPSLLGLSARAPYLHDGCAERLRDRFGPCGGDAHGDVVTGADLDALIAFLETL